VSPSRRPRPWLRVGSLLTSLGLLAGAVTIAFGSPAGAADMLPSNVKFEQWKPSTSAFTTGAVVDEYTEGQTVPFRLDVSKVPDGTYSFSVCRDFTTNPPSDIRGYLFLAPYNTTLTPVIGAPIMSTLGNFSGAANGGTVTIDSANEVNAQGACNNAGELETQVTITIAGSPTDAYVVWGGHLAAPTDPGVGPGDGASQFHGASLHLELNEPSKDLPIQVGPETTGVVTVIKNAVPDTLQPFAFQAFGPTAAAVNAGNSFNLVDNGPGSSNSQDFTVDPGTFTIGELLPTTPYALSAVACTSTFAGDTSTGFTTGAPTGFAGFASYVVSAGEHVTCTFTDVIPQVQTGTLEVVKQLSPTTDPGVFNLFIDGTQFATNVGNGGTTGVQTVTLGSHSVSEAAGLGTLLSDYSPITVSCVDAVSMAPLASGSGSLLENVAVGVDHLHVLCVFTNTRGQARLRVIKILDPSTDPGLFNLTVDGTVDAANVGNNGDTGFVAVDAGTHAVGETAGTATDLANYTSSIICTHEVGPDGGTTEVTVRSGAGTGLSGIPVGIGDDVTCRITNHRNPVPPAPGTITIVKNAQPNSTQDFTFTPSAGLNGGTAFLLDDDGNDSNALPHTRTFQVDAGTYTVTEAANSQFDLKSIVCNDTDSTGNAGTGTATIVVAPGEHVTCTFTNMKHGVYGNDPAVNPVEQPYAPNPGTQDAGNTGQNGGTVNQPGADPATTVAGTNVAVSPADPAAGPGTSEPQVQGADLPRTGAPIAGQTLAGLLLIGGGLLLMALRRRRSSPSTETK